MQLEALNNSAQSIELSSHKQNCISRNVGSGKPGELKFGRQFLVLFLGFSFLLLFLHPEKIKLFPNLLKKAELCFKNRKIYFTTYLCDIKSSFWVRNVKAKDSFPPSSNPQPDDLMSECAYYSCFMQQFTFTTSPE